VEAIGWDVVTMLLPYIGKGSTRENAARVLDVIIAKGNAKEVFLKCNEGLKSILWERTDEDEDEDDDGDDGEATLAEKIARVRLMNSDNDDKVDPVVQTEELCRVINIGDSFSLPC
jgi:Uncharacterised protein family, YAP/Alf4/glomulin